MELAGDDAVDRAARGAGGFDEAGRSYVVQHRQDPADRGSASAVVGLCALVGARFTRRMNSVWSGDPTVAQGARIASPVGSMPGRVSAISTSGAVGTQRTASDRVIEFVT
jgi:hypothetical protein